MKKIVYLVGILLTLVSCNERGFDEDIKAEKKTNLKKTNDKDSTNVEGTPFYLRLEDGQDPAIIVPPRR
jgi:riboflavin synthase alpha subunit